MTTEDYNQLQSEDFPMTVKYTGKLYENIQFTAEHKSDFSPYGYHHIEIIQKNKRLKIFSKNK
mgnify:CR=1 FL=1